MPVLFFILLDNIYNVSNLNYPYWIIQMNVSDLLSLLDNTDETLNVL